MNSVTLREREDLNTKFLTQSRAKITCRNASPRGRRFLHSPSGFSLSDIPERIKWLLLVKILHSIKQQRETALNNVERSALQNAGQSARTGAGCGEILKKADILEVFP